MKVLLVAAATPDTFWSFKHIMPLIAKKAAFPPLGLATVAAMLPREWDLKLVDLNVERLTDAQILWADYVLVSAMIVQADSARDVIARSNKLGRTVVAGGPLFTTCHASFPEVKHFAIGEAENIMPSLVADMESGNLKPSYQDDQRPDVRLTPPPRWDLIRRDRYALMALQFSRGCPFNCEFCDIIVMNGRVPRVKEPAQMLRELDTLVDAGWEDPIFIVDDNFIGNKVKVKAFLRELVAWRERRKPVVTFITEASLNLVDDTELLDLMVRAGFKKVFVGIETPEVDSLVECAKGQNTQRDMASAVKMIQNAGIEVMGGFIIGFDNDKANIFDRQRRFIQETGIVTAMVGLLMALPGTRLFSRLKGEGRLVSDASGNNVGDAMNFIPKLDRQFLVDGYRSLVQQIYAPKVYYRRILTFLREYDPKGPGRYLTTGDIKAFFRSLWLMGAANRGRREFWKFLTKTLIYHRRAFPEAMSLAIQGYHFRKVAASL